MQIIPLAVLKSSKHRLNEPVFILASGNILHSFIARAILEVYDPESQGYTDRN